MSSTRIPYTKSTVSYGYTVSANGVPIGNVQGFNPTQNRNLERVREIMNEIDDIVEIVPGRTDISITIDRFETYDKNMMEAMGFSTYEDISQITTPILIMEEIRSPITGAGRKIQYQDCWFSTWGKTVREGTITVTENVTIFPTRIRVSKISA
ncbi:MAG: hypothetical protein WC346_10050 [Methanogenium sp.]|jgi:hypothetical protein